MSTRPITVKPLKEQTVRYSIVVDRHHSNMGSLVLPHLHIASDGIITLHQARRMQRMTQATFNAGAIVRILRVTETKATEVVQ